MSIKGNTVWYSRPKSIKGRAMRDRDKHLKCERWKDKSEDESHFVITGGNAIDRHTIVELYLWYEIDMKSTFTISVSTLVLNLMKWS
jgi:hypothetical protein